MSNVYKSPWARQYCNPLKRRQGEGYKHHEDRLARYAVIAMVIIAVLLMAWTAKAVPDTTPHTSHAEVTRQAKKIDVTLGD